MTGSSNSTGLVDNVVCFCLVLIFRSLKLGAAVSDPMIVSLCITIREASIRHVNADSVHVTNEIQPTPAHTYAVTRHYDRVYHTYTA